MQRAGKAYHNVTVKAMRDRRRPDQRRCELCEKLPTKESQTNPALLSQVWADADGVLLTTNKTTNT